MAGDIAGAIPAFAQLAPDAALGFAPTPGAVRSFSAVELNQHLSRHGVQQPVTEPVCFEWPMRTLTTDDLRTAMLGSLPEGSEVDVTGPESIAVPPGPLQFPPETLRNGMWRGYVAYDPPRRFAVPVQVTVRVPWNRVVARETIPMGARIAESMVHLESGLSEPMRGDFAEELQEVIGRLARRSIRAGASVERSALGEARVVARGDAVHVEVVSGAAILRFDGIAEAPATAGAFVPVRNPDTGKIVHARVNGEGSARLNLSGKEN